jgi:sarcosine oxidase subunit alpha
MTSSREGVQRLPTGGLIERSKPLAFHFDGRRLTGYQGDTLASALLGAGVRVVGRSFKYHRPRGILCCGSEEPNALVELRTGARSEPNTRATTVALFDGLEAQSQNRWPSLAFDVGAINSLLAPLFMAGFYYKTFMWPPVAWEKVYEPLIRRAAGLGRASRQADPDRYEKVHAFCDVLIVGAGPAGLAAALSAGRCGARVILCDEDFLLGGRLNGEQREINGAPVAIWLGGVEQELSGLPDVRILSRTSVFGMYDGGTFGALQRVADHLAVPEHRPRQRLWKIVAKRVVLAAGAIERSLVFGGNDLPGVMLASAARTYLNRFAVRAGHRIAVYTATDSGWETAFDLAKAGVPVEAVVDSRSDVPSQLTAAAKRLDVPTFIGARVLRAQGGHGLRGILVEDQAGHRSRISVDTLAMSGGWNPNIALSTHLGGKSRWRGDISAYVPGDMPSSMTAVGAAGGSLLLSEALREGSIAGVEAAAATGYRARAVEAIRVDDELNGVTSSWNVPDDESKAFVDFQHDVTIADIVLAAREGFTSAELLKRYTTLGMGTDQGKTSGLNGLAMLAAVTGRAVAELGTTAFRPPYTPVAIAAFAGTHRGRHYQPTRLTTSHSWAKERGASFVEVGQWLRARWFSEPGEKDWMQTVSREVRAVRSSVGVCDVSTLGKIDIQGPDAGELLDRIYINTFSTIPVGKARYGLMLREDGFVLDDGTSARLAAEHFVMSTTTLNAGKVMQHLEHARQVLWPELDVQIVSVTEQWAQYAIAGPNARRVLQALLGDALDLEDRVLPYLAAAEFSWGRIPARLFRISFSGELAYELAVPARYGSATLRAIMQAGAAWDIVPYGTEALGVMRIEKGHVAGNEINGTTTAADLCLGRMMSTKKDFIGCVLARRPALSDPSRLTLVGLKPVDQTTRLYAGAHLLPKGVQVSLQNDSGYLTSAAFSPMLDCWIALGLLSRGPQRYGEHLRAYDPLRQGDIEVEVCSPVFFDPEGARLRC